MAYAAYLDAFEAKLKNKGKNSNPFGSPPSAGGVNQSSNQGPPQSEEEKKAATQAIQDLHADGKNVETMEPEQLEDAIFVELKNVFKENDNISEELREITWVLEFLIQIKLIIILSQSYSADSLRKGEFSLLKKENFQEISNFFSAKNVTQFAKTLVVAGAFTAGFFKKDEILGMASSMNILA